MANLFRKAQGLRWTPDADATNAPEGTLLRAENTVPDETGARALRLGSVTLYTGLQEQRVHSLYTPTLQTTVFRLAGIDDQVYRDGVSFGVPFDGDGDIAFGDDAYQAFCARGQTKKKFDAEALINWGIDPPILAPLVSAITAITDEVMGFGDGDDADGTVAVNEGTGAFVDDYAGNTDGARSLVPNAGTGRASISKVFAADIDFMDVADAPGSETDLFDIRSWLEDPRKVDTVRVMFGLNTGTDPFLDDYYYFDFNINRNEQVDIKDPTTNAAAAYKISNTKRLSALSPQDITEIKTPEAAGGVLRRLGPLVGATSGARYDSQQASPAWGHFTVTRGQFKRVGGTVGRDWSTVRGFKVVYTAIPGSTEAIYLDDAIWTGGGSRSLTGTYLVGYRFARQFKDDDENEIYTELSPMSPLSDEIVLSQQSLQVTIISAALAAKDPQVDQVWVYLYGGFLDTFYRFVVSPATVSTGMTIDEITTPSGSDFDSPEKRTRLTTHGFTISPGAGAASTDLVMSLHKSELEALIENEVFTPGSVGPPDNIISIAGPLNGRMYALTSEGWLFPSSGKRPSTYSVYHAIDLRRYGTPYWSVRTQAGIYVGLSKDIIFIDGSGGETEDHVIVDLFPRPLNVANPPVDKAVATDGNSIIFRSADGLMYFSGQTLESVPPYGTSLLWRGYDRHGIFGLNIESGRFRMEVDNHNLYMLAPEGSTDPTALWRYDQANQQWERFTYPYSLLSLHREPDGSLLAGATDGKIVELEIGTQDSGADIPIEILTPIDDGGNPLGYKAPADDQVHADTGGSSGTMTFYKDGDANETLSYQFATSSPGVYRADITALGRFLRVQRRISGSFATFLLHGFGLSYRPIPQHVVVLDGGYILPRDGANMAWLAESEFDCQSASDLSLLIYKDDVLWRTLPISVTPGVRTLYITTLPNGTKARRLRLMLKAVNGNGSGPVGFEPFGWRVRHRGSGGAIELPIAQGDQGSV